MPQYHRNMKEMAVPHTERPHRPSANNHTCMLDITTGYFVGLAVGLAAFTAVYYVDRWWFAPRQPRFGVNLRHVEKETDCN